MIDKSFLPQIFGLITFLVTFLSTNTLRKIVVDFQIRNRRKKLIDEYVDSKGNLARRVGKQLITTQSVIDSYGNRIVKGNYRSRLQKMLVTSGDWENLNYSNLVRRKIVFSALGFSLVFLFLLLRDATALPIVLSLVIISYLLPDIDHALRRFISPKYRKRLETLLDRAGEWQEAGYFRLVRRKVISGTFGFIIGYFYLVIKSGSFLSLIGAAICVFIGFFLPDMLLQNRILKRKELIANTLPDAVDMLQMSVSAGLAFPAALSKVAETQSGPVSEEFARVTTEVQLGKSRSEALAGMAQRTQERNVQKFVSAMQQVTTFGIPVTNVLMEQAKEMRAVRRDNARERGQKVPIKILAPIMLCFLPTVLVIVLGPAIVSLIRTFG